jgi:hypothetical protein
VLLVLTSHSLFASFCRSWNKGKVTQNQSYRDDPDALSLHTTPDDEFIDDIAGSSGTERLLSYSESENIASAERENATRAGRVARFTDDYSIIQLEGWRTESNGKKGSTLEVSARMDPRLSNPDELYQYVNGYLQWLQPKPVICVSGYHWHTVYNKDKKEKKRVTDFDITLSLRPYLVTPGSSGESKWRLPRVVTNGEQAFRGGWRKTRALGSTQDLEVGGLVEKDLRTWVDEFCGNEAALKVFRVARTSSGMDVDYLKNAIEQLIRGTHYRGHIDVQVIVEDRAVDLYSDHWINVWRNGWQRFIFYFTFLWIFTWPLLFFMTKKWAVFTIDWPFSVPWPERGHGAKRFATISEEEWITKHQDLIKGLVLDRFQGETDCISLETIRGHRQGRATSLPNNTGNANVESAVSLIQAGVSGWNAIQRGMGRDVDGWGLDD